MQKRIRRSLQVTVFMWIFAGLVSGSVAQERQPEDIKPGADAMPFLKRTVDCLSGAKQLQVKITSGYDVVQASGQKVEFREDRQVTLVRPSKLRIDTQRDDGNKNLFLFDGSRICVYDWGRKIMATASHPGDIDGAVKYFVKDLKMRIPLALMFTAGLPAELSDRVKEAKVVQKSVLCDVPCIQIAARADNVDFQVWVPEKGDPLPLRIVITYREDAGQPQYWSDLSQWSIEPNPPESTFTFVPPEGSEKVPFLAEISKVSGKPGAKGGRR